MWILFDPEDGSRPQGAADTEVATADANVSTGEVDSKPQTFKYQNRELNHGQAQMVVQYLKGDSTNPAIPSDLKAFADESPKSEATGETPATPQIGEAKAASQTAQAETAEQTTATSTPNDPGNVQGQTHDAEELAKATQALLAQQFPKELVEQMPPDELIRRGEKAAKSQAHFNRTIGEKNSAVESMQAQIDELKAQLDTRMSEPDGDDDDGLASMLPDDEPTGYERHEQALKEQAESHQIELDAVRATTEDHSRRSDEAFIEIARRDLYSEYPQLKDSEKFKEVHTKVYELAKLEGYHDDESGEPDIPLLMMDASRIVLGQEQAKQQQSDLTTRYREQTTGQPDDIDDMADSTIEGQPMTKREKMLYAYELQTVHGKTPDQIRQITDRIPEAAD
jgi:hypothetical protein